MKGVRPWALLPGQQSVDASIVTGALEVKVPAVGRVVVWVAPQPARGLVVGRTRPGRSYSDRLLWPTTSHCGTGPGGQRREDLEGLPGGKPVSSQNQPGHQL